jgi:DNA-binding NarL/FixJ family response regulator
VNRLLLVEDDDNKRAQLLQVVRDQAPTLEVMTARSLKSGLLLMKQNTPDAILLDMTLPTFDIGPGEAGGDTHPFGGREFLQEMRRFKLKIPVVVVTQFETFDLGREMTTLHALDLQLKRDYPEVYLGAVYYHAAIQSWKDELITLMGWRKA